MTPGGAWAGPKAGPRLPLAAVAALLAASTAAAAPAAAAPFELATSDGEFSVWPRGRLFLEAIDADGSDNPARNGSDYDVRTLYLGLEGKADGLDFILIGDFAGDEPALRSAYVSWSTATPLGALETTLGNRLSERGIDGSSSSVSTPFIERNLVSQGLAPQKGLYGLGLSMKLFGEGWHVAGQVAGDDVNHPEVTEGAVTTMLRGHWNPVHDARRTVHLGAWAYHEALTSDLKKLSRTTKWISALDAGAQITLGTLVDPRRTDGAGLEFGGARGPAWAFAEYGQRRIETASLAADVRAWSVSAGWALTGERPAYSTRSGTFVQRAPSEPLSRGGLGGWEIVARVQQLDNSDAPLGGVGEDVTIGLNWSLEAWARLMLNASHWRLESRTAQGSRHDVGDAVLARFQVAF